MKMEMRKRLLGLFIISNETLHFNILANQYMTRDQEMNENVSQVARPFCNAQLLVIRQIG